MKLNKIRRTMDYEKKYKEEVVRATQLWECGDITREQLEYIFPELAESEDEKIKKSLINYINAHGNGGDFTKEEYIAWLEKQDSKTNPYSGISFEYNGHIWGMCARDNGVDILLDKQIFKHLEQQGEEPNWCHHKVDLSDCSEEYRKAYYDGWNNCNMQHSQCKSELDDVLKCLINGMRLYYEDNEEATWGTDKWYMPVKHIIEILEKQVEQNTKHKTMFVKFLCKKDWHGIGDYCYGKIYNGYPCEKEQKGYDVYDDNHIPTFCDEDFIDEYFTIVTEEKQGELKPVIDIDIPFGAKDSELIEVSYYIPEGFHAEIEGSNVVIKKGEQKPDWSEEDKYMIDNLIRIFERNPDEYYKAIRKDMSSEIVPIIYSSDIIDWLKSLKNRVLPKSAEWSEDDGMFARPLTPFRETAEVTTRLPYVDDDLKPIAEFIMDYCLWDLRKDNWNQPVIVVPLFRVLDALIQRGKPYCGGE